MGGRHIRHRVGAGVLALAGAVTPATARGAPSSGVAVARAVRPLTVLEAYVGGRPDSAAAVLEPLFDELAARGLAVRPPAVVERVGGRVPRPGVLDPGRTAAEIAQLADTGYEAYTRGRFADAEGALRFALEQVHRNPAVLVLDTTNLGVTFKILVGLALSQARRGDTTGSAATMVELIRTFRGQPIMRTDYGPDAERLYRAVWKQTQAMARGELAIAVDNEQAVIFVDGQIRGLGKAALGDLLPGVYRVFVQVPATAGRQYEVVVTAQQQTTLHIDWELDSALWVTDTWLGLVLATEAERARLPELVGRLAHGWGDAAPVAVVGLAQVSGQLRVTGTLFAATGAALRSAEVALDGGDDAKLRALARFLDDGSPGEGVAVLGDRERRTEVATRATPSRLMPQLLIGGGVAALVAGGVLYAIDQDPAMTPTYLYRNTAPAAVAVGSVGIAAMTMGLWWWAARGRRLSGPTLAIGHSGAVLGWTGEL